MAVEAAGAIVNAVLSTVLALAKKVPANAWVGLAGVVASSVIGCYERGQGRQDGALAAKQAAHAAAEKRVDSAIKALADKERRDSALAAQSFVQVAPAVDTATLARTAVSRAIAAYLAQHPASGTVAGKTVSPSAIPDTTGATLARACSALSVADSVALLRTQQALTDCQRRGDDQAQQAAAWRRKDSLDTHVPAGRAPRLVFGIGGGYDLSWVTSKTFTGRPFGTVDATLALPLGFQAVGALSVEPHVPRPADFAVTLHHDFAHIP